MSKVVTKEVFCCFTCNKIGLQMMRCSHCKSVTYCNEKCQSEDRSRHRPNCKPLEKQRNLSHHVVTGIIRPEPILTEDDERIINQLTISSMKTPAYTFLAHTIFLPPNVDPVCLHQPVQMLCGETYINSEEYRFIASMRLDQWLFVLEVGLPRVSREYSIGGLLCGQYYTFTETQFLEEEANPEKVLYDWIVESVLPILHPSTTDDEKKDNDAFMKPLKPAQFFSYLGTLDNTQS